MNEDAVTTALACYTRGEHAEAERVCLGLLATDTKQASVWSLLGALAMQRGTMADAVERFRHAIELEPTQAVYYLNLGEAYRRMGDFESALVHLARASALAPRLAEAHFNLGLAYNDAGRFVEAAEALWRALSLQPRIDREAVYGDVLRRLGKLNDARVYCQSLLQLYPNRPNVLAVLGGVLQDLGLDDEAIRCHEAALSLDPSCALAHFNLGLVLRRAGQPDQGVRHVQRGLELEPRNTQAWINLGSALLDLGRVDEAVCTLRRALAASPDSSELHCNLLFALAYHPAVDAKVLHDESVQWARRHALPVGGHGTPRHYDRSVERRLRIGYVSAEFRDHVESYVTLPLFRNHDHRQFEIFCYSAARQCTRETDLLRLCADVWRDISNLTDLQAAELIAKDRIDILVTLGMHQGGNRTRICAYQPAPVQISWLAYPGTTGMREIHYRITDRFLDPPGADPNVYSETPITLRDSFWCYDPRASEPKVNELPAIGNGFVTFGCLNKFAKVNRALLELWAELLLRVENSRLLMVAPPGEQRRAVRSLMNSKGIDDSRVEFVYRLSRTEYLATYQRIDVGLDTLPYNGGITTLDAIWMGVPVVTSIGRTVVGRSGCSIAMNLDCPEWVAHSESEYVATATALAGKLDQLAQLRCDLRARLKASPLMDGARFARSLEQLYRQAWMAYCKQDVEVW